MDDEFLEVSNRPKALQNVDRLKKAISAICETRLYPGARDVMDAATDIAANTYLMLLEGNKPEVAKDFWLEVGMKRGKTPITKLVNYVIDETQPELRRIVQEAQNQITSGVSILDRDFKPVRFPTLPEVMAEMERISKGKGLAELHRLWMTYLSRRTVDLKLHSQELIDIGKRSLREQEAQKRGLTVEQLATEEEQQRRERDRRFEQDRLDQFVSGGTVVGDSFSWLRIGAIYVEHQSKLVQLSDADRDRVRACMTKH